MSRALLATQKIKLLKIGDRRYIAHMNHWIGAIVTDLFLGLNLDAVVGVVVTPAYFLSLAEILRSVMIKGK